MHAPPLALEPRLTRGARLRAEARFVVAALSLSTAGVLWLRSGLAVPPVTYLTGALPVLVAYVATVLYAVVGLIISLHRPEVRTGRILAWVAIVQGVRDLSFAYLAVAQGSNALPLDPAIVAWANYLTTIPIVGTLLITLALIFPTDRPMSPRWWRVALTAAAGAALVVVGGLVRSGPLTFVPTYENPVAPPGLLVPGLGLQLCGYAVLAIAAVAAATGVALRYRRADRMSRIQLRIFMASSILLAGTFVLLLLTSLLETGSPAVRGLVAVAFFAGTALMPIAVLVAVVRYRLYAIDQIVGRGFVYGALLAILAGLYAASIRLFTALFTWLSGESSDLSLVVTTLILATTFTPIKSWLEGIAKKAHVGTDIDPAATASSDAVPQSLDLRDPSLVALIDARIQVALGTDVETASQPDDRKGRQS